MPTGSNEGQNLDSAHRVEPADISDANGSQAVTTRALGGIRTVLAPLFSCVARFGTNNAAPAEPARQDKAAAVPEVVDVAPEAELGTQEILVQYRPGGWNPTTAGAVMSKKAMDAGMRPADVRNAKRFTVTVDSVGNQVTITIVAPADVRQRFFEALLLLKSAGDPAATVAAVGAFTSVTPPTTEGGAPVEVSSA